MFVVSDEDLKEIVGCCVKNFEIVRSNRYMNCAAIYGLNPENQTMISNFMSEDSCIGSIDDWLTEAVTDYKKQFSYYVILTLSFDKETRKLSIVIYDK